MNDTVRCYRCEFSVQTTTKRDIQYASPVTSYIQIWLKNLVTVFGNPIPKKFAHQGEEVWKRENRPFSAFFFVFLERKRMLTLEIYKNEVELARLVNEANFPVFLCIAKFNFIKPHLLTLC